MVTYSTSEAAVVPIFFKSTNPLACSLYPTVTPSTNRHEVHVAGLAVWVTCNRYYYNPADWAIGIWCSNLLQAVRIHWQQAIIIVYLNSLRFINTGILNIRTVNSMNIFGVLKMNSSMNPVCSIESIINYLYPHWSLL